ncbi:MAG: two-component system, NtrC family, response regulator PilR [Candidatus Cloacimonadota bacterium]|nr:two-component system, NtrC family, response regulator PilR [Candidatus Cloacimonadota bacterium]
MAQINILVADDDYVFCRLIADFIRSAGYKVATASTCTETQALLEQEQFDLLMLDMRFPALQDGFDMLEKAHEKYPAMPILMISGSGHIPDAVNAIKYGATDFIEKPIAKEHLLIRLASFSESIRMQKDLRDLQVSTIGMVGDSEPMQKVYDTIIKVAKYETPVLITGETGVGKELAAEAIHRLSANHHNIMIKINCASIPAELFEAQLFGYEKGAFTGADRTHKGYFESAQNSSLFLDEISELPLRVQAKLLRVLSEGEIQKLGSNPLKINTRLICASNKDLDSMVAAGRFRQDLYYRISAVSIEIPPLRQRRQDIIPIAEFYINRFCSEHNIAYKTLAPAASAWLMQQDFPGNVRQLKNLVERALVFSQSDSLSVVDFTTTAEELPDAAPSYRDAVHQFERNYIRTAFLAHDSSLTRTAHYLKMDKSNLSKKMQALGLNIPPKTND